MIQHVENERKEGGRQRKDGKARESVIQDVKQKERN